MPNPTSLSDYIKEREQRKVIPMRRKPVWIQRMEAKQLPNKDYTGKGPDAA